MEELVGGAKELEALYLFLAEFLVNYSFQLLGALIVFLLGMFVAGKVRNLVLRICERNELDTTLSNFIANVAKLIIIVMVAVIALGKLGISIGPFVAAIGALSLGAGLAVQGLLSNYGAGFNIIITRPFVVGDTISVQDVAGIVTEVRLATTILTDADGVAITIPNRHIVGEIIRNSREDSLVEVEVGISYASDPQRAIEAIRSALQAIPEISQEHSALVGIERFGESGIDLQVRFWGPTAMHYQLRYRANGVIHQALQDAGIAIPFPQREVRLLGETA